MSNLVYPALAGISMEVTRSPQWKTTVLETPSGREYRGSFMTYPRYLYTLKYEFLRDSSVFPELRPMIGFFNTMQGSFDSFLFTDPDDSIATAVAFAVGDGTSRSFQLTRPLGSFYEPIYSLNGAPQIFVNGVLKATPGDYSISTTGYVTFVTAPANGAVLTWTGAYYFRCRFVEDAMDFDKFMAQLWSISKVQIRTVKP